MLEMIKCNGCGENKPVEEYYIRNDELIQPCKICARSRRKKSKLFGVRRKKPLSEEKLKELRSKLNDKDYIDSSINHISKKFSDEYAEVFIRRNGIL